MVGEADRQAHLPGRAVARFSKNWRNPGGYRPGCSCLLSHPRAGVARGFVGVYRRVLLASRVVGGQRRSSLTAA